MTKICIFCTKNCEQILRFWNSKFDNRKYEIEYTQCVSSNCDVLIVMAEGGFDKFKFYTNASVKICFTGEPECIYKYSNNFLKQFTHVVTSQDVKKSLPNDVNVLNSQQCLCPLLGNGKRGFDENEVKLTLSNTKKTKLISAFASNKCFTQMHRQRRMFLEHLKNDIPELDLFGSGTSHQLNIKDDGLRDYKFSIAIENCQINDYWTEKLSDCILSECDVIYCGCQNINKYFDNITTIDINDYDASLSIIRKLLESGPNMNAIRARKKMLFEHYLLLPTIEKIICL